MNPKGNPVYTKEGRTLQNTGRGGNDEGLTTNTPDEGKNAGNKEENRINELRSRFGEAFMPFASKLESVREQSTERKRKGRTKRDEPRSITTLPQYKDKGNNKMEKYSQYRGKNIKN